MIVFRNGDARYPFLWENDTQPAARWHGDGEGPVQYFADTPDGAWAEFVRHEELTDIADLAGVHRAIWAIETNPDEYDDPALSLAVLTGDESSYGSCHDEARVMRSRGSRGIVAPSAALKPGTAGGHHVDNGLKDAPPRDGRVFVLFGRRPDVTGWRVTTDSRPPVQILEQVHYM